MRNDRTVTGDDDRAETIEMLARRLDLLDEIIDVELWILKTAPGSLDPATETAKSSSRPILAARSFHRCRAAAQ